jgi:hypothetical protein
MSRGATRIIRYAGGEKRAMTSACRVRRRQAGANVPSGPGIFASCCHVRGRFFVHAVARGTMNKLAEENRASPTASTFHLLHGAALCSYVPGLF